MSGAGMAKTLDRGLGDGVKWLVGTDGLVVPFDPEERARVAGILSKSTPPAEMHAAPVAPARGPMALVDDYSLSRGGIQLKVGAHWVAMGPIGEMIGKALLAHIKAKGGDAPFVPPFTIQHQHIANEYIGLTEARAAAGVKCPMASLLGGKGGGGGGGGFIDAYMDAGARLAAFHARIGVVVVMDVRRHMDRDNARCSITARALVDMVCLQGRDLSAVLRAHGWSPKGATRAALRVALCEALDRMMGVGRG